VDSISVRSPAYPFPRIGLPAVRGKRVDAEYQAISVGGPVLDRYDIEAVTGLAAGSVQAELSSPRFRPVGMADPFTGQEQH